MRIPYVRYEWVHTPLSSYANLYELVSSYVLTIPCVRPAYLEVTGLSRTRAHEYTLCNDIARRNVEVSPCVQDSRLTVFVIRTDGGHSPAGTYPAGNPPAIRTRCALLAHARRAPSAHAFACIPHMLAVFSLYMLRSLRERDDELDPHIHNISNITTSTPS